MAPPSRPLGVAVIGYGFIGKVHTCCYKSIPMFYQPPPCAVRLVGVCTSRPETARAAREHGGFEFATTSPLELIARDDVDIVNVCTPNLHHAEVIEAAMRAGKHIYCDKPLTAGSAEAARLADIARDVDYAGKFQMTFQYRFLPATLRAKELVNEGAIGEVIDFRGAYLHTGYADPGRPMSWRLDRKLCGGGALYDLGSHLLDLLRHLIGEFDAVFGSTHTYIKQRPQAGNPAVMVPVEVDDVVNLLLRLPSGIVGHATASRLATGTNDDLRFEIHGTKGALRFNLMEGDWLDYYDATAAGSPHGGRRGFTRIETIARYGPPGDFPAPRAPIGWIRAHMHCLYCFLRSIAEDQPAAPGLLDGVRVQQIMDAAYRSAENGQWVRL